LFVEVVSFGADVVVEFDTVNVKEKDKWQLQKERKVILSKGMKFFELKPRKVSSRANFGFFFLRHLDVIYLR
jgi:hypothetical protein